MRRKIQLVPLLAPFLAPFLACLVALAAFRTFAMDAASDKTAALASIEMADLPGGSYVMGVQEGEEHEQQAYPAHVVHIKPFRIAKTDVTFDQYDAFVRATHALSPQDEGLGRGLRPVVNLNRREMLSFIAWLNAGTGRRLRLPSEAEWEYAARGGTTTSYSWGDKPSSDYANLLGTHGRDVFETTSPVASFLPNPFGLFDMAGNVWQEVEDCRHPTLLGAPLDGRAWTDGPCDSRIARGGWYHSISRGSRVTSRSAAAESFRSMSLGFRMAEDL